MVRAIEIDIAHLSFDLQRFEAPGRPMVRRRFSSYVRRARRAEITRRRFMPFLMLSGVIAALGFGVGPLRWMVLANHAAPTAGIVSICIWIAWLWIVVFAISIVSLRFYNVWLLLEAPFVLVFPWGVRGSREVFAPGAVPRACSVTNSAPLAVVAEVAAPSIRGDLPKSAELAAITCSALNQSVLRKIRRNLIVELLRGRSDPCRRRGTTQSACPSLGLVISARPLSLSSRN